MLGVGEENTRPSTTRVLDQITGGDSVCFLAQTIRLTINILWVYILCHITHTLSIYIQKHKDMGHMVQIFLMNLTTHVIIYKFIRKPGVQEGVVGGLIVWGWSKQ